MSSKSSYHLFTQLLWNILRRPMSFFDTTHSGVITNRCTADIETIDFGMPIILLEFLTHAFSFLASLIVTGIGTPFILVIMLPVMFLLGKFLQRYLRSSIELRRLSRLSRSPILSTISELVNGLTSIRLYGFEGKIEEKWSKFHNLRQTIGVHSLYARLWIFWKCNSTLWVVYVGFYCLVVFGKVYNLNFTRDAVVLGMLMNAVFSVGSSLTSRMLLRG